VEYTAPGQQFSFAGHLGANSQTTGKTSQSIKMEMMNTPSQKKE
jgi:hypothetical protein